MNQLQYLEKTQYGDIMVQAYLEIIRGAKTTKCKTCGNVGFVFFVGSEYRFPYDGACPKCHGGLMCNEPDIIKE